MFTSGSEPLDRYFRNIVGQDVRRDVAKCYVALTDESRVVGYYTLASASLSLDDLPPTTAKKLPRYSTIPAVRIGRLAVDQSFQGQGLGTALLGDAIGRTARSEIAAYALIVDAKNEAAASFYRRHEFAALLNSPLALFLPLAIALASQKDVEPDKHKTRPGPPMTEGRAPPDYA